MYGWIYTGLGALLLSVVAFFIALRKRALGWVQTASRKVSLFVQRMLGRY